MGLRDRVRRDADSGAHRYQMRENLLSIGDDYWIENESGERAFKVDGKAVRLRDTFILEDVAGEEVAKIQERKLRVRDTMEIERAAGNATVHKALIGLRDRFKIDVEGGPDMTAHGNLLDHEYEIEADGNEVAAVSKKWFRVRELYGVEIEPGQDDALILAITVCVDALRRTELACPTGAGGELRVRRQPFAILAAGGLTSDLGIVDLWGLMATPGQTPPHPRTAASAR